eukprot:UN00831
MSPHALRVNQKLMEDQGEGEGRGRGYHGYMIYIMFVLLEFYKYGTVMYLQIKANTFNSTGSYFYRQQPLVVISIGDSGGIASVLVWTPSLELTHSVLSETYISLLFCYCNICFMSVIILCEFAYYIII